MASSGVLPTDPADHRAMCKYGDQCYQTNPMHTEKFRHPNESSRDKRKKQIKEDHGEDVKDSEAKKMRLEEATEEDKPDDKENAAPVTKGDKAKEVQHEAQRETVEELEEEQLPVSPEDVKESIRQKFLVDMPEDFYHFWEFCKEKNHQQPDEALLATCGLKLVGPFDVLSGKLKKSNNRKASDFLLHYRYYFDTPEFQTVIANPETDFHIGYFRDDPKQTPSFVASNNPSVGCHLTLMGDNLFGALFNYITGIIKDADPFKQTALQKLKESIHVYATMRVQDQDLSLEVKSQSMKSRDKLKLTATFHGAGMVVPYNKETQVGYREIPETTASLKKIFKNVVEAKTDDERDRAGDVLQELVTNAQFANDEGDSMGLELGINAFCYGGDRLHPYIEHLLGVGYELLGRNEFAKIIRAHLNRRNRECCFKIQ